MELHESVTEERILDGCRKSLFGMEDDGICIACGEDAMHVEPDAEKYKCESCGEPAVYGCEQMLLMGMAGT